MDYLQILLVLLMIFGVGFLVTYFIPKKGENIIFWIFTIMLLFVLIITPILALCMYNSAVSLPYRFESACRSVEKTESLLMKFDDIDPELLNSLGYGLEASRLKSQLRRLIEKQNGLRAEINSWVNNPLMPFKNVIRERLPMEYWED